MSEENYQPPTPQQEPIQPQQPPAPQPNPIQPPLHPQDPMQPHHAVYEPQQPVPGTKGKGVGIAAMILGIIGAVCAFIPVMNIVAFPLVIVGLILGIVSVVLARGGRGPKGFGIAGIACSAAALIITIIMYITLAAAAVVAYDYVDDNIDIETYTDVVAPDADISVQSVVMNESESSGLFIYVTVTLENNTSEIIDYVQVQLPLYDESGAQVETALGNATSVSPGVFEIDAIAVATEGVTLSFNEEELIITTL